MLICELFVTKLTWMWDCQMWLFICVNHLLMFQNMGVSEQLLVTNFTWISLFTCVSPLMNFQRPWFFEFLSPVSQEYGLSPVWILSWYFNELDSLNFLSQNLHEYGFSLVWIFSWDFKENDWVNLLSQVLHKYVFSPVWYFSWAFKACDWVWISCHKSSMNMVFHLCESFHDPPKNLIVWISCRKSGMNMAFHLCESSHETLNLRRLVNQSQRGWIKTKAAPLSTPFIIQLTPFIVHQFLIIIIGIYFFFLAIFYIIAKELLAKELLAKELFAKLQLCQITAC